jgi:dihydroflavonol-4-reductase
MAKKLILGGNGFIGSAIMRNLLADGEEVRCLVHSLDRTSNLDGYDVDIVQGDICDGESIRRAAAGCDTVYFTSAYFSHYNPNPRRAYEVNVGGTKTTLQVLLEEGMEKVVYTSTNNAVGGYGATPVTEEAEFNYWQTGDHYSQSKYLGEVEALRFAVRGLPVVIVNPTYVIGTHDAKPTSSGQLLVDVATGRGAITMRGHLNVVDVEDVARGQINAAERGRVGERYLLGNTNISIPELQALVADIAGVARPRITAPYPLALAIAYASEGWARISGGQPFQAIAAIKIGRLGESYDCQKAVNELGLPQTPIEVTIRRALDWFESNGLLKAAR